MRLNPTASRIAPTEKTPQKQADFAVSKRDLKKCWSKAISAVDRHSATCRKCAKRLLTVADMKATGVYATMEPYRLCPEMRRFYGIERETIAAYRAAIGHLVARVLLLAPIALFALGALKAVMA